MNGIEIVSTGYAKIEKTLDNQQLEQMVETSNEWIVSRTGILKRHLSDKSSAFLAIEAAKKAGIETIAIYDKYSDADTEAIKAQADFYLHDYTELLSSIDEL